MVTPRYRADERKSKADEIAISALVLELSTIKYINSGARESGQ